MKKIMVIGAGDFQLPLAEAAAAKGQVILVAPKIDERFDKFVSARYFVDVRDKERILTIAQNENVDGVVTDQTDIPVRTVAYVAEKMGLNGIGYEVSKLFTDKFLMREKMKELNLPILPYKLITTVDEAVSFYKDNPGEIIIKPIDTQGSRGVMKVSDAKDIADAFAAAVSFSQNGTVLAEKYASGIEFVVEAVTDNYKCHNLICGDTIYFNNKSLFSAKKRTFPSLRSSELVDRVLELNRKIVEGFGLPYGITHAEFVMDKDEIYLLEIAARGGGVFISSDLIYEKTGFHSEDFLINKSLAQPTNIQIEDTGAFVGYRAFYIPSGKVVDVSGIDRVKSLPHIRRHQFDNIRNGMTVGENTNKTSRIAFIVVADSYEQWEQRCAEVADILHVKVSASDGSEKDIIWE